MELFQDPTFRLWYIGGGMLLLVVPMLCLSYWYHPAALGSTAPP